MEDWLSQSSSHYLQCFTATNSYSLVNKHNYWKSHCFMRKLTISVAMFNSYVKYYQRVYIYIYNVVKTTMNYPFGNGTIYFWWWLGDGLSYCFNHITQDDSIQMAWTCSVMFIGKMMIKQWGFGWEHGVIYFQYLSIHWM